MTSNRRTFLKSALMAVPAGTLAGAPEKAPVIKKVEVFPTSVEFKHTFVIGRGQVGAASNPGGMFS